MDRAVDLLKLLQRGGSPTAGLSGSYAGGVENGYRIIRAVTADPNPTTFVFEGTSLALDLGVFEVPFALYPICVGDKFFTCPIIGGNTQRWAVTEKINGGAGVTATMLSSSTCQVTGIGRPYTSADLLIPKSPPTAGDTVLLVPVAVGGQIKYAIAERY